MTRSRRAWGIDLAYAVVLPAVVMYVTHFLFVSNYTGRWTVAFFEQQYTQGIYRYRILGRWLVLLLTDVNAQLPFFSESTFYGVGVHFEPFSPALYWAYFQVNLVAFVGTAVLWWYALKRRLRTPAHQRQTYLVLVLAAGLGMSVVVPYDMLAYFFLSGTLVAYHARLEIAVPALAVLTVLGTLTRETQFLALAYAISVIAWRGLSTAHLARFASIATAFGGTYVGLRLALGTAEAAFRSFELVTNLTHPHKVVGIVAMALLTVLVVDAVPRPEPNPYKPVAIPLVLMSPYLGFILLFAKIDEIRLIVPVEIVLAFFLAWVAADG